MNDELRKTIFENHEVTGLLLKDSDGTRVPIERGTYREYIFNGEAKSEVFVARVLPGFNRRTGEMVCGPTANILMLYFVPDGTSPSTIE